MSNNPKGRMSPQTGDKLTPLQVANMRAGLYRKVENQIEDAHKVVMGKKEWSPTQARVFSAMLGKVMPDLTAQFVQHEHTLSESPEKLSRSQLEAIASGMNNIIDVSATEDAE
jgi:uncharacterized protein YfkK (UPF0435 family)